MKTYLENLISEKEGIELHTPINVEGESGMNFLTVEVVIEHILIAPKHEQDGIRAMLVKIDFHNASVLDYFKHLAQAIAR